MFTASQSVTADEAYRMAVAGFQSGDAAGAAEICRQLISVSPRHGDALHLLGVAENALGDFKSAVRHIRQAIKLAKKSNADLHCNLALALQNDGKAGEALQEYRRALVLKPDLAVAHMNMGNLLKDEGDAQGALERLLKAVDCDPALALAQYNLGLLLQEAGEHALAAARYVAALEINSHIPGARANLGVALKDLGRAPEARAQLSLALAENPEDPKACNNLAILLAEAGRHDEAAALYARALKIDPDSAEAHNNLGTLLNDKGMFAEASELYARALALQPGNADSLYNLGFTLARTGKIGEAVASYRESLSIKPDNPGAVSDLVHQMQHVCAWDGLPELEARLLEMIRQGRTHISPFNALALPEAVPADHLSAARVFSRKFAAAEPEAVFTHAPRPRGPRLKIGYLSPDFHQHATAHLLVDMLERHDHARFEISAYSYSPDDGSALKTRILSAFDRVVDIGPLPHAEAAKRIHADGIDILVDLKGYTGNTRTHVCAYRPAPVQVNYLGYPGTMGAEFLDYIIADPFIAPLERQADFSEKIAQLPGCYQPSDSRRVTAKTPTRAECGLPEDGFVFCSFNNTYKITPETFSIWMGLLRETPGSVLWLLRANPEVRANLEREAAARGIDPSRLVFAPMVPMAEHLARHAAADLFLDTWPVNAHTTANDALWSGLPVLTMATEAFVGRVAGSLLHAAGLPELVTHLAEDYAVLALSLAHDPARLADLKTRLAAGREGSALFDMAAYARNIEKAYEEMWRIFESGEAPRGFLAH